MTKSVPKNVTQTSVNRSTYIEFKQILATVCVEERRDHQGVSVYVENASRTAQHLSNALVFALARRCNRCDTYTTCVTTSFLPIKRPR